MKTCSIIIFILFFSCTHNEKCNIDFIRDFKSKKPPLIYILSKDASKNECLYNIILNLGFPEFEISSKGLLYYDDSAFYIKPELQNGEFVKYFDFTKKVGEEYIIPIIINNENYIIKAKVEKSHIWKDGIVIYVFRFRNTYYYQNKPYDSVIFASLKNGIVGSYISGFYEGVEYMVSPSGEVVKNMVDSTMEIRVFR